MVKIRLKRIGRTHDCTYRIVVSDSRNTPRGMNSEEIGSYDPNETDARFLVIDEEAALRWLSLGARPSESVLTLLKKRGNYQKFLASKKKASSVEHTKKELNKTSGKQKVKAKENKAKLEEARVARHKANRLAKRQDKQGQSEAAAE